MYSEPNRSWHGSLNGVKKNGDEKYMHERNIGWEVDAFMISLETARSTGEPRTHTTMNERPNFA